MNYKYCRVFVLFLDKFLMYECKKILNKINVKKIFSKIFGMNLILVL